MPPVSVKTPTADDSTGAAPAGGTGLWRAYLTTFGLTLTNPMTILSFAATFAGLGLAGAAGGSGGYGDSAALVLGVYLGSALWWLLLSGIVGFFRGGLFRDRTDARALQWLNRISGVFLFGFGMWSLARLITSWPG